ncbi:Protein BCCIP -like protein [Sarcoptes scabiei]|nr:Protein BCCIP -like protein [Sarcoptes scabiei]
MSSKNQRKRIHANEEDESVSSQSNGKIGAKLPRKDYEIAGPNVNNGEDTNEDADGYEEEDYLEEEECLDESENQSDDDGDDESEIQVDFGAYNPSENDLDGIVMFLKQLWLKETINISNLASQESSEQDEDEDDNVYGLITVIPFALKDDTNCVQAVKQAISHHLPEDNQIRKKLNDEKNKIVLVLHERFANLSPKISIPCYDQILNDLKDVRKESEYQFDYILMVCKLAKHQQEIIFTNGEEELFSENADETFEYSVVNQSSVKSEEFNLEKNDEQKLFEPYRKILLLSKDKWLQTIQSLKNQL